MNRYTSGLLSHSEEQNDRYRIRRCGPCRAFPRPAYNRHPWQLAPPGHYNPPNLLYSSVQSCKPAENTFLHCSTLFTVIEVTSESCFARSLLNASPGLSRDNCHGPSRSLLVCICVHARKKLPEAAPAYRPRAGSSNGTGRTVFRTQNAADPAPRRPTADSTASAWYGRHGRHGESHLF